MGYKKGSVSREQIIKSGAHVVLAKGFTATTSADLMQAAETSVGKFMHHFPTKENLFLAVFEHLLQRFETGPLARLGNLQSLPKNRISEFFDGVYALYALHPDVVGCPLGYAASDSGGVTPTMKKEANDFLKRTGSLLEKAFRELHNPAPIARAKASLFVNAWQGAIVIARAGGGLRHVKEVFRHLKVLSNAETMT